MRKITAEELKEKIENRIGDNLLVFREVLLCDADLSGWRLSHIDFSLSQFKRVCFDHTDMSHSSIENALFLECTFHEADFRYSNMKSAALRCADLAGVNIENANLCCAVLEDAKRTSATMNSCRCSKAKVLTIKSFDCTEQFEEATSLVDENFVYKKGEWVEVKNFNEDRWRDSTTGIHFWMTREEAIAY